MTEPNEPQKPVAMNVAEHANDDASGDWRLAAPPKPVSDPIGFWSYLIAAAILLPIGWWAKENLHIAETLRAWFGH